MKKLFIVIVMLISMTSCFTTKSSYYSKGAVKQTRCYK